MHDPQFLILDEPTSGLDPEEREALLNRVRTLCTKYDKSALISTHILPDVQSICEHVIILSNGCVRVSDRLEHLSSPIDPQYILNVDTDHDRLLGGLIEQGLRAERQHDGKIVVDVNTEIRLEKDLGHMS